MAAREFLKLFWIKLIAFRGLSESVEASLVWGIEAIVYMHVERYLITVRK